MSLTYTYKWQAQPYVAWKGPSTNSVAPTWSQPLRNGPPSQYNPTNQSNITGPAFKARPIKAWRKQLQPRNTGVRGSRSGVGMPMDVPGGSIYLGSDSSNCLTTDCTNGYALKENLAKDPATVVDLPSNEITWSLVTPNQANYPTDPYVGGSLIEGSNKTVWDPTNDRPTCIACNPENNRIRRKVQTNRYYKTDYRNYLRSRNRTYKQNLPTGYKLAGGEYFNSEGKPIYPNQVTDPSGGTPYYQYATAYEGSALGECADITRSSFSNVSRLVAKPNNRPFAQQGAVSSSTRLLKLKVDTVTQNANSLSAWGQSAQNAVRYSSRPEAPFILKSKNNVCFSVRRVGNHTNCFLTPTGNVTRNARRKCCIY
tara:strand:- start:8671 stop:9777 length:1107 start_codon:yes stop_codon:yes gene_type:complete